MSFQPENEITEVLLRSISGAQLPAQGTRNHSRRQVLLVIPATLLGEHWLGVRPGREGQTLKDLLLLLPRASRNPATAGLWVYRNFWLWRCGKCTKMKYLIRGSRGCRERGERRRKMHSTSCEKKGASCLPLFCMVNVSYGSGSCAVL